LLAQALAVFCCKSNPQYDTIKSIKGGFMLRVIIFLLFVSIHSLSTATAAMPPKHMRAKELMVVIQEIIARGRKKQKKLLAAVQLLYHNHRQENSPIDEHKPDGFVQFFLPIVVGSSTLLTIMGIQYLLTNW
jgi:uncharacterized membrane protein